MKAMKYTLKDGTIVPLFEGDYDMSFKVWKSDRAKSVIGHPRECIEAKGLCKLPGVTEAFVGSGKVAYVVFEKSRTRDFKHALRFIIPMSSQKVRDTFDQRGAPKSQILVLRAPSNGQTMAHRRELNKARAKAVKEGRAQRKPRAEPAKNTRFHRLGVHHRPRAQVQSGTVSF